MGSYEHPTIDGAHKRSRELLPDKSSMFFAELHTFDRVETADDDERNFIIFSDFRAKTRRILLSSKY